MKIICTMEDCGRRAVARSLCQMHYMRWKRHGDAGLGKRPGDWGERERHPLYQIWSNIKRRCFNESDRLFPRYGGRGITLHAPWAQDFMCFARELEAEIGPRPSLKHSLDRRDNDDGYKPGNLRWATPSQQSSNRRNSRIREGDPERIKVLKEQGLTNKEISKQLGLNEDAVRNFLSGTTYTKRQNPVLDLFIPQSIIKAANENTGRPMTCAFEGCDATEHYGHGYCRRHYKWLYESESYEARKERKCENCGDPIADDRPISTKFCTNACLMKWNRKHGCYTAEAIKASRGTCSVEGCDAPVNAKGYCSKHYSRMMKYGDPDAYKKVRNFCKCVEDGAECGRPVVSHEMCSKHYQRYVVLPKRRAAKAALPPVEKPPAVKKVPKAKGHGTEEERARKSAATKAMWARKRDEIAAAIKAVKNTPEEKARTSEKARAYYESEEAREVAREYGRKSGEVRRAKKLSLRSEPPKG